MTGRRPRSELRRRYLINPERLRIDHNAISLRCRLDRHVALPHVLGHVFGRPLEWSRQAIYALGFFGFWLLGITSSTLTLMLTHAGGGVAVTEDE